MGYTIKIGQAEPAEPEEGDHEFGWSVATMELPDAPRAEGDPNPGKNYRWPSYGGWDAFTREIGLYSLFYEDSGDGGGLMRPHPGVIILRPEHGAFIRGALEAYRLKHPSARAGFSVFPPGTPIEVEMQGGDRSNEDGCLARLEWLSWWVDWALANCSRPAMENR